VNAACPNVTGGHALIICYRRPWRRAFRRQYLICCWTCTLRIAEP
jgi:hypothetical protein